MLEHEKYPRPDNSPTTFWKNTDLPLWLKSFHCRSSVVPESNHLRVHLQNNCSMETSYRSRTPPSVLQLTSKRNESSDSTSNAHHAAKPRYPCTSKRAKMWGQDPTGKPSQISLTLLCYGAKGHGHMGGTFFLQH